MKAEISEKRESLFTGSEMHRLMAGSAGYKPCEMSDEWQCFEKNKGENGFDYVPILEAPKGKKLVYKKDESFLPDGAVSYVLEKCCEILAPQEKSGYKSESMQNGTDKEPSSVQAVELAIGRKFTCAGDEQFFFTDGAYGCTPDGVMYDDNFNVEYGLEIKNPNSDTHLFNLINLKNDADLRNHYPVYYWQCMTALAIFGCESWIFASYDDRFEPKNRLLMIEIARNESEIARLKNRVRLANELKNKILLEYR